MTKANPIAKPIAPTGKIPSPVELIGRVAESESEDPWLAAVVLGHRGL